MPTDTLPWTGLFDLFRIGVGPSSSHTVGPMVTVARLVSELLPGTSVHATTVQLFGFLALTGKGHATDVAVIPGLLGAAMQACVDRGLRQEGQLPGGLGVRRRAPGLHARLVQRQGGDARDVLHGNGPHFVSLGQVIRTMRDTGRDTSSKHKETSEGRLAVNAIEC